MPSWRARGRRISEPMFFVLSKLLIFLLKPITWVAILLLWSWLARSPKRKKRLGVAALALLLVFSNPFLFNLTVNSWEMETITADQIEEPYDIGILLGGFSAMDIRPAHDRHNFNDRANRFLNTLELYRSGKIERILITGGSGRLVRESPKEADQTKSFLLKLGVPEADILTENESRNTWENAKFTEAYLTEKSLRNERLLLITSAWHMPRALNAFHAAGLTEVTPFSVDFLSEELQPAPANVFLPNARFFFLWELIVKEWVGILAYSIKGYN